MLSIHERPLSRRLAGLSLGTVIGATVLHSYSEQTTPTVETRLSTVSPRAVGETILNYCDPHPRTCLTANQRQSTVKLYANRESARASRSRRELYPTDEQFDELVGCEAEGDWNYGGPNGHVDPGYTQFEGGPNFWPPTWRSFKPKGYPEHAYEASRRQQIIVARLVYQDQGWDAWPRCSKQLGFR